MPTMKSRFLPGDSITHLNGNPEDNRFENLRIQRNCACGCGETFIIKHWSRRYLNEKHQMAHWARLHPRAKAPEAA